MDRERERLALIASTEGGMEIEEVAARTPEKILSVSIDPCVGLMPYQARQIGFGLGLSEGPAKQLEALLAGLLRLFVEKDASQIEINPLIVTKAGELLALDAKLNFDDNALYRHPDIAKLRDPDEEDPREREAKEIDLAYVGLDGNIGCMVNGAGLAMATLDMIQLCGGRPANFLDAGGGADQEKVKEAFKLILRDPNVKAILVNIFGGIVRCDLIARGRGGGRAGARRLGAAGGAAAGHPGRRGPRRSWPPPGSTSRRPRRCARRASGPSRRRRGPEWRSCATRARGCWCRASGAWGSSTRGSRASTAPRWWRASRPARAASTRTGFRSSTACARR